MRAGALILAIWALTVPMPIGPPAAVRATVAGGMLKGHTAASAILTAVRALPALRVAWLRVRGRWHASYAHHVPVPRNTLGAVRRLLHASSPMLHTACHVAWCTSHIAQCMQHGLCVARRALARSIVHVCVWSFRYPFPHQGVQSIGTSSTRIGSGRHALYPNQRRL